MFHFIFSIITIVVTIFSFQVYGDYFDEEEDVVEEQSSGSGQDFSKPSLPSSGQKNIQHVIIHEPEPVQGSRRVILERPPTDVVTVPESQSEKLRRARREAEETTEGKIQEKLEILRLKAEQERLNKIMSPLDGESEVVNQDKAPIKKKPQIKKQTSSYSPAHPYYFQVGWGWPGFFEGSRHQYLERKVLSSSYAWSAGLGVYQGHAMSVDYTFSYSTHQIYPEWNRPSEDSFAHFHHALALKYFILSGRIKPFAGFLASVNGHKYYSSFRYEDNLANNAYYYYGQVIDRYYGWNDRTVWTLNGGISAGVDILLGSRLAVSVSYRFHMHLYELNAGEYNEWPWESWSYNTNHYYGYHDFYNAYYEPFSEIPPHRMNWHNFDIYLKFLF